MLTLCYSILSYFTLILFHYASMLTLQNSLLSRALWLPQAVILGSLECIMFLHIAGLIPEHYWFLSFVISILNTFMEPILPIDVFNLDCSLPKNLYFWYAKLSHALAKKQGLDIFNNSPRIKLYLGSYKDEWQGWYLLTNMCHCLGNTCTETLAKCVYDPSNVHFQIYIVIVVVGMGGWSGVLSILYIKCWK